MNDVIDLLQSHRSIRKFTDQQVPQETLEALIRTGQAAATSSFIQATTVIRVSDPESRDKMATWAGGQRYVSTAPEFLVFCADMHRHMQACEMHDAEGLTGYTEQLLTATVDVALFAQNVVVAAESLGLGICYIGGLRNRPEEVSDLLDLPALVYPVFGMCIGHPAQDPETKPRLPIDCVLKQERYSSHADPEIIAGYDEAVAEYYRTRTGNNKQSGWSEQISGMLGREARPHMLAFLQERGFMLR